MSSLNELGIIPECDIARANERARQRAEIEFLKAERDALRAEVARLTTLRPATEHRRAGLALWHFSSGAATVSYKAQIGSIGWTPLPKAIPKP